MYAQRASSEGRSSLRGSRIGLDVGVEQVAHGGLVELQVDVVTTGQLTSSRTFSISAFEDRSLMELIIERGPEVVDDLPEGLSKDPEARPS